MRVLRAEVPECREDSRPLPERMGTMGKGKNFKPMGNKKSGKSTLEKAIDDFFKPSGGHGGRNPRKIHDTKGKNNHGRSFR